MGQGANTALPIFAKLYQEMNKDASFDFITKAKFEQPNDEILDDLDCKPEKRDGLLKTIV